MRTQKTRASSYTASQSVSEWGVGETKQTKSGSHMLSLGEILSFRYEPLRFSISANLRRGKKQSSQTFYQETPQGQSEFRGSTGAFQGGGGGTEDQFDMTTLNLEENQLPPVWKLVFTEWGVGDDVISGYSVRVWWSTSWCFFRSGCWRSSVVTTWCSHMILTLWTTPFTLYLIVMHDKLKEVGKNFIIKDEQRVKPGRVRDLGLWYYFKGVMKWFEGVTST